MQGRAGLLFPFEIDLGVHFISGLTVRPPDCENDSICKIHLMKEINWVFKMEGKRQGGVFHPCCHLPAERTERRTMVPGA